MDTVVSEGSAADKPTMDLKPEMRVQETVKVFSSPPLQAEMPEKHALKSQSFWVSLIMMAVGLGSQWGLPTWLTTFLTANADQLVGTFLQIMGLWGAVAALKRDSKLRI